MLISELVWILVNCNVPCKTQLPWQLEDSDKSFVVLEDISPCDNKGKTSSKRMTIQQIQWWRAA